MQASDQLDRILRALRGMRVPATPGEYDLHAMIARALAQAGLFGAHEARLAPGVRVDFLLGDIALEVKKGRPPRVRLLAQAQKYLACPQISSLVVVSQKFVRLPDAILGKPVYTLSLDKLWGVSLP